MENSQEDHTPSVAMPTEFLAKRPSEGSEDSSHFEKEVDLMEIHEKLLVNNQEVQQVLGNGGLSKEEIQREVTAKNEYAKELLEAMRDQIIECYQMIENNAVKKVQGVEERKDVDLSVQESYQDCDDELDRVSEQFSGMIRLGLPVKRTVVKYQIFKIIKAFVGKDLTKSSLPVFLNEPLSLLQRMSEVAKFIHLIEKAMRFTDPNLKLAYIGLWAASNFAGTRQRLFKPFNPILGETFELECANFKLYGEQYSHHPPIGVIFIDAPKFTLRVSSCYKTSFWGKYIDLVPTSPIVIECKETGEIYECFMPKSCIQNIIIGNMYIDHYGIIKIINRSTKKKFELNISGFSGWFKKADQRGRVTGTLYEKEGDQEPIVEIRGNWDDQLSLKYYKSKHPRFQKIWKKDPEPKNWDDIYKLSIFSLQLNKISKKNKRTLPPTDSRFRPDQRALENGDLDLAETEKKRLEEKQRQEKKQRDANEEEYKPRYFQQVVVDRVDTQGTYEDYVPCCDYWKEKANFTLNIF
ncbi:unnamed protein product [Moneuplotes crassus]|uniref:Oxysterol-binding protein n=1 Tax=Euplotes crassus TaxID=5936 RepID=A0AAD1U615_EUPCR|nr:unnamed protein product [Moneuplotes crassus]